MGYALRIYGVDFSTIKIRTVTPTSPVPLESLSITGPDNITIPTLYSVEYTPSDTTERDVTWSIESGESYATISSDGVVTPLSTDNQNVTIRATSQTNPDIFAEKTITVCRESIQPLLYIPFYEDYNEDIHDIIGTAYDSLSSRIEDGCLKILNSSGKITYTIPTSISHNIKAVYFECFFDTSQIYHRHVFSFFTEGQNKYGINLYLSPNDKFKHLATKEPIIDPCEITGDGVVNVVDSIWHKVAIRFDSSNYLEVYMDGSKYGVGGQNVIPQDSFNTMGALVIGGRQSNADRGCIGKLKEFRFFENLTEEQCIILTQ